MGSRGPKPGFKQRRAEQAAAAAQATAQPKATAAKKTAVASPIPTAKAPTAPAKKVRKPVPELSAADRENPAKLSGDALRELAHKRGLAKSDLPSMSDDKIREQLRYMTHRQYDDAVA